MKATYIGDHPSGKSIFTNQTTKESFSFVKNESTEVPKWLERSVTNCIDFKTSAADQLQVLTVPQKAESKAHTDHDAH